MAVKIPYPADKPNQEALEERMPDSRVGKLVLNNDKLRYIIQTVPWLSVLVLFLLMPLIAVVIVSFWLTTALGFEPATSPANYVEFFTNPSYYETFAFTLGTAAFQIVLAAALGFPIAYYLGIKKRHSPFELPILLLFVIPFVTSYILRTLSWIVMFQRQGIINNTLLSIGAIDSSLDWLLFSNFATNVALLSNVLPFMIFLPHLAMSRIDDDVLQASADLGASKLQTVKHIILPQTMPGLYIGAILILITILGDNVAARFLGGSSVTYTANDISVAVTSFNIPLASAMAVSLFIVAVSLLAAWEYRYGLKRLGEI